MAISLVDTATAQSDGDGGNVTLTMPGGVAAGDLVLVGEGGESAGGNEVLSMVTSGYTGIVDIFSNDTRDSNLGVHWKIMGGTPDSDAVITGFVNTDEAHVGQLRLYRGVDQVTPIDVASVTNTGIDGTVIDPNSITPVTDGAVVVVIVNWSDTASDAVTPTGFANPLDNEHEPVAGQHFAHMFSCDITVSPAAATDPSSMHDAGGTGDSWTAAVIALRPAAGGGGGTVVPIFDNYYRRRRAA